MNFLKNPHELKIGIIGLGFVGNAIEKSYYGDPYIKIVKIDNDQNKQCVGTYNDLKETEAVFVCVPSPQRDDGSCDTSMLCEVLSNLKNYHGVIISKSTAPPDVYELLQESHPNLVHVPEFLTAANAVVDYSRGKLLIIGGKIPVYMREAERIIKIGQREIENTVFCSIGEASLIKYTINTYLATKVIFMNEVAQLTEKLGYKWDNISQAIQQDPRIGPSHNQVPGPDGKYGFGGACFPKDTSALLKFAEDQGISMNVLGAAVKKNTIVRLKDPK